MASSQQKLATSSSQQRSVSLISPYLFFEMLSFKKYQETSFLIPDTILLEKGMIKQWLFNSEKQQNKILKKKKQNCTPLNVVKSFCFKSDYNFSHIKTFSQLRNEFISIKKEQSRKQPLLMKATEDKKIIEIITLDDQILSMSLSQFIYLVSENRYNQHTFYDKWKIIRQKVNNESRIEECYEVISFRKNHIIESKCHKVISLETPDITPVSSRELSVQQFKDVTPKSQTLAYETKNLEGYKFFDTFLNKKFFSIVYQLIQFIQKNYKCIVEEIRTKFVINKNRQPHFVGVYGMKVKPVKKLFRQDQFQQFSQKGFIRIQDYMKFLGHYLVEIQKDAKTNHMALTVNIAKKTKCHGQFCKVKVKKLSFIVDPATSTTTRSKHFNLDPAMIPTYKKLVSGDIVNAVRKRKQRIMQKLKQQEIIDYNTEQSVVDSSQYEESEQQTLKNVKVCQNCYSIYSHIQRIFEIDFRSGNLVEKKQSILNDQTLKIRTQSQKRFPPILKRLEFERPSLDDKLTIDNLSPINKEDSSKKEFKFSFKQNQSNQKLKSLGQRAKSHTKLQSQPEKFTQKTIKKVQDLKRIKLDPIQSLANNIPTKGNRLLALAKSTQGTSILNDKVNFKKQKEKAIKAKITKAKNFEQAQNNLLSKLSILPSSSKDEFLYFATKYAKDNMPQQLDCKCFSSEYLSSFYQFMMNSELNLASKNRIRKRPQISLKRLSQLTDYPEIVSKSAFHFDTIITDEKTTIPFCVITTKMINGKNAVNIPYENIIICQDIFDSFIEYIPLVKDILDSAVNKRVILFNYPGQSHTIYNNEVSFNLKQFSFIFDKLLYRLSTEKEQLGFINFKKDKFKFIGFGFGGYLLSSYLANNYDFFVQQNLTGVLLVNTYKNITQTLKQKAQALKKVYQSDDQVAVSEAYLFYNKAIQSSQTDKEDLQYKAGLNPIRNIGRVHLLKSLLDLFNLENNQHNSTVQNFENLNFCPVHIFYGSENVLFSKNQASKFLKYEDTKLQKIDIPLRKIIEIQGGHDLMADNYQDLQKYIELFVAL